jgi:hypothetical protein
MRLFSYCIPIDDGAAPNPFHGRCTLVICKPKIRRVAEIGDWVVGIGSKNVNGFDYSGKLVYAMKVTEKLDMQFYDEQCRLLGLPKIPNMTSPDYIRKLGDCIYDFSNSAEPVIRPSVHTEANRKTDLGGKYALRSDHFYYFGDHAELIPDRFSVLIRQGRNHQSKMNESIKEEFIEWVTGTFERNKLYGSPQIKLNFTPAGVADVSCATQRCKQAEEDEMMPDIDNVLPLSHWNYFLALESDLKVISRYVEVHENNYNTFSIALTQLFLATCSEVDIVLKDMCRILSGNEVDNMGEYRNVILRKFPSLRDYKVAIPLYGLEIMPWQGLEENKGLAWWTAYNEVKHSRNIHFAKANLWNCINALGALYIGIFNLIRVHQGKREKEFSANLIYQHLQPRQELFLLQEEDFYRDIAEGRGSMMFPYLR